MRQLIARLVLCSLLACRTGFATETGTPDETLLQRVLAGLGQHAAVRADFVQTRSNPALDKPQVSRGQLLFALGHGMLWQTQAPYQETLALTDGRGARVDVEGKPHPLRDARGVSHIARMLQSMLAGRVDDVQRQFDVAVSGTPTQWTLRFTPKQARVANVLAGITLNGDAFLQGIRIVMRDGSCTDIRFSHTRDAGPPSPLEKRALDLP